MDICRNLKILVERSGEPLTKIAAELGISQASLSRIINCKQEPGINVIINASRYFKVPINKLIGLKNDSYVREQGISYSPDNDISTKINQLLPEHKKFILELIDFLYDVNKYHKKIK